MLHNPQKTVLLCLLLLLCCGGCSQPAVPAVTDPLSAATSPSAADASVPPTATVPTVETTQPTVPPTTGPAITVPPTTGPVPTVPPVTPPATTVPPTAAPQPTPPPTTQAAPPPATTVPPATAAPTTPPVTEAPMQNEAQVLPEGEAAIPSTVTPVASGTLAKENGEARIDYSNTKDGYVMVKYLGQTDKKLKAQVAGPTTTYTYNLTPGQWAVFPLSDENGNYRVTVYKNVTGTKYASVLSVSFTLSMTDEFAPFLCSNQYVDFHSAPNTVAKAAALVQGQSDPLKKVELIYNFVIQGISYDKELAAAVTSGYLPNLDSVLQKGKGICFDYAALMTGMLRSQGVPTKLVIGYAGDVYHAWINVWSASTGWVDGAIFFDGKTWQRMDPTFASSGNSGILDYIGDGTNYAAKYFY